MRIDVILEPDKTTDEVIELGQLAERMGFGAVWMPNKPDGKDPFAIFSVLARFTHRIKMGPIAVSPFELHPLKMAMSLLTLNEISGGRAVIVVGGGGGTMEAIGVVPERRLTAIRECVEILKMAASGATLNYPGEIYPIRSMRQTGPTWINAKPPQIYVGANKEKMLGVAARCADGIFMSDIPIPLVADLVRITDQALVKQGESRNAFQISNFVAWHVKEDRQAALREARRWLALRGMRRTEYLESILGPDDLELVRSNLNAFINAWRNNTHIIEGVPDRVVNALVDGLTLCGDFRDIDRIIDELKQYEANGLTEIALRVYGDPAGSIRLIGERVIPAFNQ